MTRTSPVVSAFHSLSRAALPARSPNGTTHSSWGMATTRRGLTTKSGNKKAKVALIGTGRMGVIRASILRANPRFDFVGVVDVNPQGATSLAEKFGIQAYTDLEQVLDDQHDLQGIVVSSPTSTHAPMIQQAAQAGVSVFCEKPVGESAPQIQQLFDVARAANIHLCCGFQRRFDPSYQAAATALRQGAVGTPIVANIFFADHPVPPKPFLLQGGDIFLDLCAHDVDFVTHALQDHVVSVYATGITSRDPELQQAGIHDNALLVMTLSQGAVATLFLSRSATYGYDQRMEIFGTLGMVTVQNQPETSTVLATAQGIRHDKWKHSFPERFAEAFALELEAFADTLLEDKPWPVSGEQCVNVQRVADAARQSCLQGRVVEIKY